MRFRRNPLPQRPLDAICYLLVGVLLPMCSVYQDIYVLPAVHEKGSFSYNLSLFIAIFILLNIEGNLIACMIIDTSLDHEHAGPSPEERREWRFCTHCSRPAPPRSWHCKLCGSCILKRDHHCAFTGCCIGHYNQRYFICFLVYLFLGAVYSIVYNSIYMFIMHRQVFFKLFVHSVFFLVSCFRNDIWVNLQILISGLNVALVFISMAALIYFIPKVFHGEVCHETKEQHEYNNGFYMNLRSVLGNRMHVAWIFPVIKSQLPEDGYTWRTRSLERIK